MADQARSRPGAGARRRRRVLAGVALLALAAVGVAVGVAVIGDGDGDGNGAGPGRPDPPGDSEPRRGGTLRIAVAGVQSLDPMDARDPGALMLADHLFETLVEYEPETFEAAPGLAEAWEVDPEQRVFTFRLREGATFHDGSPVTAADVKATLERIAAPGSASDFRFLLEPVTGYSAFHLQGGQEGQEAEGQETEEAVPGLDGVRVLDRRTVEIELTQPWAQFPLVLGNAGFGIVPAAAAASDGFDAEPVGSGPVRLVSRDGDVVRLERFDDHHSGSTWVDAVEVHVLDEPEDGYALLRDGDVDLAPVPADRVGEAMAEFGEAGMGPYLAVTMFGFNLESPALQDVRFRRAILAAANPTAIVDVAYGGSVLQARGVVPSGVPGGVADACGDRCDHDPAAARALVAEAFPDGNVPTVVIDFDDDDRQRRVATALEAGLEEAGIPTELRPHSFDEYGTFVAGGEKQLFRFGWIASFPSADDFLVPQFMSGQDNNLVRLAHPDVDELLRGARAEPDRSRRHELYRQAEQIVLDQFVVIPVAQFTNRWAVGHDVGGFSMSPLGTFDITEVFVSRAARTGE